MVETFLSATKTKGVVYDPYIGTGTTAIVCKKLGFNYLGSEVSKNTFEIANENINSTLF